jgi:hypothetical protein
MSYFILWGFLSSWLVTYGFGLNKMRKNEKTRKTLLPLILIVIGLVNLSIMSLLLYQFGYFNSICK